MRVRILVALMILRGAGRAMGGGEGCFDAADFARRQKAPIRLINSVVAMLVRRGYLAQIASRDAGYVLLRAPASIRIRDVLGELLSEGGGEAGMENALRLDGPLQKALGNIDAGLAHGYGDMTLADMVAAAPEPGA